jgi:hypothetical protein
VTRSGHKQSTWICRLRGMRDAGQGEVGLTGIVRRLVHDTEGQVLLLGVVLIVVLLAFLLTIPNVTQVATQKVRAQTAADAGAFTGSVWLSRALNLNANMNIGVRSVYAWITVLTVGSALAKALHSDTLDPSVRAMGQDISSALFGNSDPVYVSSNIYPQAIRKLDTTALWLHTLQGDIATAFHDVAATSGREEACRNAGAYPPSQTAGGCVLVRTNDSIPLLVEGTTGDSLMYTDLNQLPATLDTIPTGDPNVGPATGLIIIDPNTYDIRAYYGDSSAWYNVKQWAHYYMDFILQVFRDTVTAKVDTGYRFFPKPGTPPWNNYKNCRLWPDKRQPGDSWVSRFDNPPHVIVDVQPGNNKYKIDTCVYVTHRVPKWMPIGPWSWNNCQDGDSTLPIPGLESLGLVYDSSTVIPTGFYSGAESTVGYLGPRVRPRRGNPDRGFHTVSYVWRQGASAAPYGLSAPMGGVLFQRGAVTAPSPMLTVARSEPYLNRSAPTEHDYYFIPAWDVKLTPFDSTAVLEIANDTAFPSHSRGSFDHLEDLRECVLLP